MAGHPGAAVLWDNIKLLDEILLRKVSKGKKALASLTFEDSMKHYRAVVGNGQPLWLCGSNVAMPFSFDLVVSGKVRTA